MRGRGQRRRERPLARMAALSRIFRLALAAGTAVLHLAGCASPRVSSLPSLYLAQVGDTARLVIPHWTAALDTNRNHTTRWSSADRSVAIVDSTGLVRATGIGATTVTAAVGGREMRYTVICSPPVLVGAGDIASCGSGGDEATAALLDSIPGIVFTAGDNVYSRGSAADFANCYAPSWGRHKRRTLPAPGNHDYKTRGARAYFDYFGPNAGKPGAGYQRYTLGGWDVFVLNSQIGAGPQSAQLRWLRAELANTRRRCQVAIMHYPLFSSGPHGGRRRMRPIWQALYEGNVEVVIAGHDHIYERFAPQTPAGAPDPALGIREFVVGTGGRDHYQIREEPVRNSEVRNDDTFGVLALTLHPASYDWRFVPVAGARFSDAGSGVCH
jgi:Predicted phosphohydrolases